MATIAEEHFNLGNSQAAQRQFDRAAASYRRALEIWPEFADARFNLGNALQDQGILDEAAAAYRQALEIRPDHVATHLNLGLAQQAQGKLAQARASFQWVLQIEPQLAEAHFNLGNVFAEEGQLDQAVAAYRRAVSIVPNHAAAHLNLGNAFARQGKPGEAAAAYQQALSVKPDYARAHLNLGNVLKGQGKLDEAVAAQRRAVDLDPAYAEGHNNLGNTLKEQDKLDEAEAAYRRAMQLRPDQPLWEMRIAALCPTVFGSSEEIERYQARLAADLQRFAEKPLSLNLAEVSTSGAEPPSQLQFSAANLRPIKQAYADVFRDCFPTQTPHCTAGTPRIGFVVTNRHEGIFLKSMLGVLQRIRRDLFEPVIVCHGSGYAKIRNELGSEMGNEPGNDSIGILPVAERFDQIVDTIRAERFDLLYYWEVGTDAVNYFLPFCRPAPRQCTSWGIQVTTGIPAMDYYLSSRLVEGEDAAGHYSEKLLLADTLLTYQHRAQLPRTPKTRQQFGFSEGQHLYLCAQHIGKFHPDFDPMLAEILRRDGRALIVVTEDRGGYLAAKLRSRLKATIGDVSDRVVFVPRQSRDEYLSLIAAADVLLDPPHFGGVNTTYDGLSLNQPIVVLPSAMHRGRYTLGCYRKMGFTECVAADARQYVEKAIRLGTDPDYRAEVVRNIQQASPVLFEDTAAVREHERIFQEILDE